MCACRSQSLEALSCCTRSGTWWGQQWQWQEATCPWTLWLPPFVPLPVQPCPWLPHRCLVLRVLPELPCPGALCQDCPLCPALCLCPLRPALCVLPSVSSPLRPALCVLPSVSCPLSCALCPVLCVLPSAFCPLCPALCVLPSASCPLRSALCVLPSAFCPLCPALCVLPSTALPSAFCQSCPPRPTSTALPGCIVPGLPSVSHLISPAFCQFTCCQDCPACPTTTALPGAPCQNCMHTPGGHQSYSCADCRCKRASKDIAGGLAAASAHVSKVGIASDPVLYRCITKANLALCNCRCWCWLTTPSGHFPETPAGRLQLPQPHQGTCCSCGRRGKHPRAPLSNRCAQAVAHGLIAPPWSSIALSSRMVSHAAVKTKHLCFGCKRYTPMESCFFLLVQDYAAVRSCCLCCLTFMWYRCTCASQTGSNGTDRLMLPVMQVLNPALATLLKDKVWEEWDQRLSTMCWQDAELDLFLKKGQTWRQQRAVIASAKQDLIAQKQNA